MRERKRVRRGMLFRLVCLGLTAVFLAVNLGGCMTYTPLRLAQLKEFERQVRGEYPFSKVECKYAQGEWVDINVTRSDFDEESAYTVLGYLTDIVRDEEFIEDFLAFHEKEAQKRPKETWLWYPPDIHLNLIERGGTIRYKFTACPYEENYNSAYPRESYTWEGYARWYGTRHSTEGPGYDFSISPEQVEETLAKYAK